MLEDTLKRLKALAQPITNTPEVSRLVASVQLQLDFSPDFAQALIEKLVIVGDFAYIHLDGATIYFNTLQPITESVQFFVVVQGQMYSFNSFAYQYHDEELISILEHAVKEHKNAE